MADSDFRACRLALGWSLSETARRLRYKSRSSVAQIERGEQSPRPADLDWLRGASAFLRAHAAPENTDHRR